MYISPFQFSISCCRFRRFAYFEHFEFPLALIVSLACMLAKTIIEVDEIDRFSLLLFFFLSEFCSGASEDS